MKKLFALFIFVIGVSASVTAQEKKATINKDTMIENINQVARELNIDDHLKNAFVQLYDMRIEQLSNAKSNEEKEKINEAFNTKILAGLTNEQRAKLKNNKSLQDKIIVNLE